MLFYNLFKIFKNIYISDVWRQLKPSYEKDLTGLVLPLGLEKTIITESDVVRMNTVISYQMFEHIFRSYVMFDMKYFNVVNTFLSREPISNIKMTIF